MSDEVLPQPSVLGGQAASQSSQPTQIRVRGVEWHTSRRGGASRLFYCTDVRGMTVPICFLIDFAVPLYAKGFKLLALDRERTTNTATSC